MNIVNRAFTSIICVCVVIFANISIAAPKHDPTIKAAYEQLVLNRQSQAQLTQSQHDYHRKKHAINVAKQQLKVRYRWGGTHPKRGFDCSGLIQYAFKKANIPLPRTAASQYRKTRRISLSQLQTGDLIFFHTRHRKRVRVNHVGIYLGNNKFIHAPRHGKSVSIANLNKYWKRKIVGMGRV